MLLIFYSYGRRIGRFTCTIFYFWICSTFNFSCIRLSETAFKSLSYLSASWRSQSMVFSSRRMSNMSFSQRMVFASHPPHERMTRNFKASSAYWRLDCQSLILPQMERPHTTPMPTKRVKPSLCLDWNQSGTQNVSAAYGGRNVFSYLCCRHKKQAVFFLGFQSHKRVWLLVLRIEDWSSEAV